MDETLNQISDNQTFRLSNTTRNCIGDSNCWNMSLYTQED